MFKSKPIGWITAVTLLGVAGIALACRLQEGGGTPVAAGETPVAVAENVSLPTPPVADPTKGTPPVEASPAAPVPAVVDSYDPPPSAEPVAVPPAAPEKPVPPKPTAAVNSFVPPPPVEPVAAPPAAPEALPPLPESPSATAPTPPAREIDIPATPPSPGADKKPVVAVPHIAISPPPLKDETPRPDMPKLSSPVAEKKSYWAGQGESLRDIAQKTLGDEERWKEIEKLNPELRSRTLVPSGTMVRLPGEAKVPAYPKGGQAESEFEPAESAAGIKPLPVIRARPEAAKGGAMMIGAYECRLSEEHGLSLPPAVREQLGAGKAETLYVTPGPDRCLWLVSKKGAERVLRRVEKAGVSDAEVQAFRRMFFSQSATAEMGADGVAKMPAKLCDFAGLKGSVVVIGADDHFEIWDAQAWKRYSQRKAGTTKEEPSDE